MINIFKKGLKLNTLKSSYDEDLTHFEINLFFILFTVVSLIIIGFIIG